MHSEATRRVLGGLLIGAVAAAAIGAYVAPGSGRGWLSGQNAGTREDTTSGTVTRAADEPRDRLHTLQRNGKDDENKVATQRDMASGASVVMSADSVAQAASGAAIPLTKSGQTHERHAVMRGRQATASVASHSGRRGMEAPPVVGQRDEAEEAVSRAQPQPQPQAGAAQGVPEAAPKAATQSLQAAAQEPAPSFVQQAEKANTAPQAAPQPLSPPTPTPTPPSMQMAATGTEPPVAAPSVVPTSRSGPKTRAEVRAEIARARGNGSLPAFGNPNPAGPGGAPSMTIPSGP